MRGLLPFKGMLIVVGIMVAVTPAAQAHTEVTGTSPAANEQLSQAPTQVTISTRETVREMGSAIVVTSPSGARVDDGSTEISGTTTLIGLIALSETGTYTVDYRLLASDGHPIEGSFTFTLVEGGITQSPSPSLLPTPDDEEPSNQNSQPWWLLAAGAVALISAGALIIRALRSR